ncbi:hypothetical protein [Streptomyces sp. NPDC056796]|uniref:hypothetical protein n=1 Tax=Streptomyces sp. NPDC056796 TaxID=3345947 RepID=UPI0036A74D7D
MDRLTRSGALAAAGLAAALALTACGSDDPAADRTSDDRPATASGPATPSGAATADAAVAAAAAALAGTWTGTSDGLPVVLSATSGKVALSAGQHICQGELKNMGTVMIALKCLDGDTARTMGSIESNDGGKLVVSWNAGATDTLSRAADAKLPKGLPTLPAP